MSYFISLVQKRQFASDVRRLFTSDSGATPKPSTQMTQNRSASYVETTQMVHLFASHLYTVRRISYTTLFYTQKKEDMRRI